jgi:hypothetical protein
MNKTMKSDPTLRVMVAVSRIVVQNSSVQAFYSEFLRRGSKSNHKRVCDVVSQIVVENLYRLLNTKSWSTLYEFKVLDNKGRTFHRIPVNVSTQEYFQSNTSQEYEQWLVDSQAPFTGRISQLFQIVTSGQSGRQSDITSDEDTTSPSSERTTFKYTGTSSSNPLVFAENADYDYFVNGYTGSQDTWNNIAIMQVYSGNPIVLENYNDPSGDITTWTYTLNGSESTVNFTAEPPVVNVSWGDSVLYYELIYGNGEADNIGSFTNTSSDQETLDVSFYSTTGTVPTELESTSTTTLSVYWNGTPYIE